MKKNLSFLLLFGCLMLTQALFSQEDFRKMAPKAGPAPRIELGKAEQFTLKNGLRVIAVENHKLPKVSFQIFVDVPPILEGDAAGYVEIAGGLLNKGTTTRTKAQLDAEVDFMGASLSTSANGVNGTCLSKHKDKLLSLMSDVLLNPVFPQEEFEKAKKQTLSGLAQAKDDPNAIADNVGKVLRNGKSHPYGEIQTEKSIENITLDQCKAFYQNYFKPGISYLIVTGDITPAEVKKLAPKYFGDWKNAPVKRELYATPQRPAAAEVDFVDKTGAVQSVVSITYPVEMQPNSEDVIKARVMNTILGGYFSSRLNANLREDKAYTYGANSGLNNDPVIGDFTADASVRNEVTDSSIAQFLLEINKLRSEEVSDEELNMVKNVMTGNFARSLEDPGTVARFTLNTARFSLPADYYATYLEKVSKVTKQDILAMAKKYLTPDQAHLLVVGNKDEVAEKLVKFDPDGKINYFDVFGKPIEDAGLSIPTGVTAASVLKDYLAALGDPAAIEKIRSLRIAMETSLQGMTLQSTLSHKAPGKLLMENSMMGQVMQQSIFDGEKGIVVQQGNSQPMEENKIADMKIDGNLFPERFYASLGVKTELKGVEMIDGVKAYKIVVEYPSGTKKTHYFDMATSLKIREVEQDGEQTITDSVSDYKEVNGVKFPHKRVIVGAAPIPLNMEVKSVEVNVEMKDEMFIIK